MGYYSPPPPGYDSPYGRPQPSGGGGEATAPLIVAILMTLLCNQIAGILGIIFAVLAMNSNDLAEQEKYIRYSWNSTWIGLAVTVGIVLLVILFFGAIVAMA